MGKWSVLSGYLCIGYFHISLAKHVPYRQAPPVPFLDGNAVIYYYNILYYRFETCIYDTYSGKCDEMELSICEHITRKAHSTCGTFYSKGNNELDIAVFDIVISPGFFLFVYFESILREFEDVIVDTQHSPQRQTNLLKH
jgi:hypothetical protein